ncbi:sigma-70 family RNA polymerase sigma factor [Telmatobacter sp. DSM 110680]|uniref:Sigma-70 family RNA polymerase sigma factor n=1 Tax=Telmatobacter sp. DSM 110680 TaxID=3036704 RepID=A0AAU7DLZ8_9BACT
MAYLRIVDRAPIEPVEDSLADGNSSAPRALDRGLLDRLWLESDAGTWGLQRDEFDRIVVLAAVTQNFGLSPGTIAIHAQQATFFQTLKLADLVLAKACAAGNERAWGHFMAVYGQPLTRAAIAISGSETVGRDLADSFYAELYGLNVRDGERRCPLDSYRGRGSLLGWLRTTLAQRFVDHYRRTYREQALDDQLHDSAAPSPMLDPEPEVLASLRQAVQAALLGQPSEERFLLAAYYVDDKTLAEIGHVLHVHEATISRRLKRATEMVRKQLLRNLEKGGMKRKEAEEALGTDPRDLDLRMNLRKLLQSSDAESITVETITNSTSTQETSTSDSLSDRAKTIG